MHSARAATVPKNTDGTYSNRLPNHDPNPIERFGEADVSSAQMDPSTQVVNDQSGIIKCLSCDIYFKKYMKPQFNEIDFKDGDSHCDKCFQRIVDEKAEAWKLACPAKMGILSAKRRFKTPISLGQLKSQSQTRFSPGNGVYYIHE